MLIKEYRICMPMSVAEYRIGQLYMIQKKSCIESSGSGSGVEILTNKPYKDGPGGCGQYTLKIYHVGSHLPGWIRTILPKSVHIEEEAWNAYPYTKTIYRCPFIEKFVMEIETVYCNDPGSQANVFNLSKSDLSTRIVDYIDMVKDQVSSNEYRLDEDPTKFISKKTGRGPLSENWREEYAEEAKARIETGARGDEKMPRKEIMCAYKLCKVEFSYWGMQSKVERFIHDYALRRIMVIAHRQAWCWQDEYYGLTIDDIRKLELETQMKLREKMASSSPARSSKVNASLALDKANHGSSVDEKMEGENNSNDHHELLDDDKLSGNHDSSTKRSQKEMCSKECKNIENLQNSSSDEEDEEFFDADDAFSSTQRRSSFDESATPQINAINSNLKRELFQHSASSHSLPSSPAPERKKPLSSLDLSGSEMLFILLHGGSIIDTALQGSYSKNNDLSTLVSTFESVIRLKYPSMTGKVFIEMVACPNLCNRPFQMLSELNPRKPSEGCFGGYCGPNFPLSSLALFAVCNSTYGVILNQTRTLLNKSYSKFCLMSLRRTGVPFNGQVHILADGLGSLVAYDLLTPPIKSAPIQNPGPASLDLNTSNSPSCIKQEQEDVFVDFPDDQSQTPTVTSIEECPTNTNNESGDSNICFNEVGQHLSCSHSSPGANTKGHGLDFDIDEVFFLGAPLGIILAYRLHSQLYPLGHLPRPYCNQLYNLFYPSDPCAFRLEPLLDQNFKLVKPVKLPRFSRSTHEEILSFYLHETLHSHLELFGDSSSSNDFNDNDDASMSEMCIHSGAVESVSLNWWGSKRVDYSLYCPEALQNFPPHSLPHLLHSSFWESNDLVDFVLTQVFREDSAPSSDNTASPKLQRSPLVPKEKWLKKRTNLKVRNIAPNHRANDVLVMEGKPQTLVARFMYGPLDVVHLSGEKVDIFITVKGQKEHISTEVTDANGRIAYTIPEKERLPIGLYPVLMVVRVDQSSASFSMAVVPPKTEVVVFSIDGSFTASVSILGKDPKVRAGAVDVVRYWHDLGYLIHYISARPDMQHKMVLKWLTQHNFPQGLIWFTDGLSAEPLRQKASHLRILIREAQILVQAAYGSNKDIFVYQTIGLQPDQVFIVGRVSKRNKSEATIVSDGYASHLSKLQSGFMMPVNLKLSFRTSGFAQNHLQHSPSQTLKPPANSPSGRIGFRISRSSSGSRHKTK